MKKKKRLLSSDGTTMVEVLVAMIVVGLMVILFAKTVSVAAGIYTRSVQIEQSYAEFDKQFYENKSKMTPSEDALVISKGTDSITLSRGGLASYEGRYYYMIKPETEP